MFINNVKFKQLREAAKNGDEKAKKIISMQLSNEDFSNDIDDYFNPKPEPVVEEPVIEEETAWDELCDKVSEIVCEYDKAILAFANDTSLGSSTKTGIVQTLQRIKDDCLRHIDDIRKMQQDVAK